VTWNSGDVDRFDSLDVAEKKANLDTLSGVRIRARMDDRTPGGFWGLMAQPARQSDLTERDSISERVDEAFQWLVLLMKKWNRADAHSRRCGSTRSGG
jgi:hypothetical protein